MILETRNIAIQDTYGERFQHCWGCGSKNELTEETVIGRFITACLEIDYKSPTPIDEEITVISRLEELGQRKAIVAMEMTVAGQVRAKARMVAVAVKDNM